MPRTSSLWTRPKKTVTRGLDWCHFVFYQCGMDYKTANRLIRYDPDTGQMFWRDRAESDFPVKKSAPRVAASWNARYSGKEITTKSSFGHIMVHVNIGVRKRYCGHRIAWLLHYGQWPTNVIDHINGNPSDNRIANLRDCTLSQNARNQKLSSRNTSGKIGVTFNKRAQKWRAWIKVDKKTISLGYHYTKAEAIAARCAAEKIYGFCEAEKYAQEFAQ